MEKGTNAVPDDGQFHVVVDGEVVFASASETVALQFYRSKREELFEARGGRPSRQRLSPEERLQRERAHRDIQAMRMESFERRAGLAKKRGGRGGRGGVP
jgi:hypothetical protein